MNKINYRYESGATRLAIPKFKHIARLGKLISVKGYRFISKRWAKGYGHAYTATHERVIVRGENGTARFSDLCWGYLGEGPRGLTELLITCGLDRQIAEQIAFASTRQDAIGTDWEHTFPH